MIARKLELVSRALDGNVPQRESVFQIESVCERETGRKSERERGWERERE